MAKDGFEGYKSEEFPLCGGWITSQELLAEDSALPIVDKYEYASGMQSLRLKSGDGGAALMVKRFALPERFPFDTSDGTFAIENEVQVAVKGIAPAESLKKTAGARAGDRERVREERQGRRQKAAKSTSSEESTTFKLKSAQRPKAQAGSGTDATTRILSASTNGGSFYIYSITGVLLAEYNRSDQCVKEYVYIGSRLLAEYKPVESRTYFYTPDQINSTRIVTDESGTVVYSAAHDPYGGIQQTWTNTYNPTPKFSGKERDSESQLDYFGARYYDRAQYRFISVDPVIPAGAAQYDPMLWNLYVFCRSNPINYLDPDGRQTINIKRYRYGKDATYGTYSVVLGDNFIYGYTLEPAVGVGKGPVPCETYDAVLYWWPAKGYPVIWTKDIPGFTGVFMHIGNFPDETTGCQLVGKNPGVGAVYSSRDALKELIFRLVNYRANEIEKEIFAGLNDLEYMSWLLRGKYRVCISFEPLAEGKVTYTWVYSY